MPLRINNNILNQKGTPAFFSDTFANRPAFGFAGRVFISTDTGQIFEDTGTAWTLLADAGVGGGTLASVTANGNSTATGIVITANGLSTNSVTNTSLTAGSVLFSGTAGLVTQDNTNLFWDDTNNRLGISTATPGAKLDIHGTGTLVQLNGTGANNAYLQFQNAGVNEWRIGNNYNAGANSFELFNNGTAAVAISVDNTLNSVSFNQNINIKNSGTFYLATGYSSIGCDAGGFFFNNGGTSTAYLNFIGLTSSQSFTFPNTSGTLALTSQLPAASQWTTSGSDIYYNTGEVSIGSTSITNGTTFGGSGQTNVLKLSSSGYPALEINSSVSGGGSVQFTYGNNLPNQVGAYLAYNYASGGDLGFYISNVLAGATIFSTNNVERARITSGGQVLIGTTSSLYANSRLLVKQTVSGRTAEIWSNYASDLSNPALVIIKNDNNSSSSQVFQQFAIDNGNSANGQINGNGASQVAFGSWSDIRLKENIINLPSQLNNILSLKPCEFDYKDGSGHQIGFIAQEIQNIYPDSVSEDKNGYLMVTGWNKTEAILVKAIQELNEKLVRNNIN
jgi:hypothetical protein